VKIGASGCWSHRSGRNSSGSSQSWSSVRWVSDVGRRERFKWNNTHIASPRIDEVYRSFWNHYTFVGDVFDGDAGKSEAENAVISQALSYKCNNVWAFF
jgi:hypothetical protein